METQKNRQLIIKDFSKLEEYGFVKQGDAYYFYTGNNGKYGKPVWTIYIDARTVPNRPYVCSHGNITLEVICRMYADGVVTFENNKTPENFIARKEAKIKKLENEIDRLKRELNEQANEKR